MLFVDRADAGRQPECGFGAIGEGGATVIDDRVVRQATLKCESRLAVVPGTTYVIARPSACRSRTNGTAVVTDG